MTPKKPNPDTPASRNQGSEIDKQVTALPERVKRNHNRVSHTRQVVRALEQIPFASELIPLHRIRHCSDYLAFNNYYRLGQVKLASANFCKVTQICSQCAQRRATKYAQAILEAVQNSKYSHLSLITLTVRNSHDLADALNRLFEYFRILTNRYKRKNVKGSFTRKMTGGVWTVEITYSKTHGWHPHIHGLIASDSPIYTGDVRDEWESISRGDSFICDSTPIKATDTQSLWEAVLEVSKYTLKNTTLPPDQLLEVYCALKGKRLIRRFGTFAGREIALYDDTTDFSQEPFHQYLFRYFQKAYKFDNDASWHYENDADFKANRKWRFTDDKQSTTN